MKVIQTILLKIYLIWMLTVFSVFMVILLPFILLPLSISSRIGMLTFYALKIWSWIFSQLNCIYYTVEGREKIQKGKSYIYTCSHSSFLDIPGIVLAIPTQFRPLAKKELLKVPVFGVIVRVVTVVVDRSSTESRHASLNKLKSILNGEVSILIFPEGTQNRTNEPLQPFYSGAFRTAIETKTPIMPMVIINSGNLMPAGKLNVKPGRIKVVFGDEIDQSDYDITQVNELKDKVFEAMTALLEKNKF
jgi:1-acyl-sn-glycerol-3-phosphate acyltransferase